MERMAILCTDEVSAADLPIGPADPRRPLRWKEIVLSSFSANDVFSVATGRYLTG